MTDDREKAIWRARVRSVSKERRRKIITDAHDQGKLSYQEIANTIGDISRQRVMAIVKEVRSERAGQQQAG